MRRRRDKRGLKGSVRSRDSATSARRPLDGFLSRLSLEPTGEGTLSQLLAAKIATAIRSGELPPGTRLPSILRLARKIGTSDQVPRAAFRILQGQNLVRARPRIGCLVLPTDVKTWRGRVIVICWDAYEGYYHRSFFNVVDERLSRARYHVEYVRLRPDARGRYDYSELRRMLAEPCDLVVAFGYDKSVMAPVRRAGRPFFLFGPAPTSNVPMCVGNFESLADEALGKLAVAAKRCGVRDVLLVTFPGGQASAEPLTRQGLQVRIVNARPLKGVRRLETFLQGGCDVIGKALSNGGRPDLILIADDYLALGGLVALSLAGCEAPRDVRLAAFSNMGLGLAYPRAVTSVVSDPFADGEVVAGRLLRYLEQGVYPGRITVQRKFEPGRTM